HALLITAQRESEHVGDHLAAHALAFDLARKLDEHLVGDVRERRSQPGRSRQLRNQHRRLLHDQVDQQLRVHTRPPALGMLSSLPGHAGAPRCTAVHPDGSARRLTNRRVSQSSIAWYAPVKKSRKKRGGSGETIIRWVNKIPISCSCGSAY